MICNDVEAMFNEFDHEPLAFVFPVLVTFPCLQKPNFLSDEGEQTPNMLECVEPASQKTEDHFKAESDNFESCSFAVVEKVRIYVQLQEVDREINVHFVLDFLIEIRTSVHFSDGYSLQGG